MITKNNIKKLVLEELENTIFPSGKRKNMLPNSKGFVLGTVNYRGQKFLQGKTQGPSKYNKKFSKLYDLI